MRRDGDAAVFKIALSIEKDENAIRTLLLRSVFRHLKGSPGESAYYDYLRGNLSREAFFSTGTSRDALAEAHDEVQMLELGKADEQHVDQIIRRALRDAVDSRWVLIGGPPCQAYSIAGRSRRRNDATFDADEKHFLYREYLRIIREHAPAVFVMENVKGLLSSQHAGTRMFQRIVEELSSPGHGLSYSIRSTVLAGCPHSSSPSDYVVRSEEFGIPQRRHRVILLGVRSDLDGAPVKALSPAAVSTVSQAIGDLPRIRSQLSDRAETFEKWQRALKDALVQIDCCQPPQDREVLDVLRVAVADAATLAETGSAFVPYASNVCRDQSELTRWVIRPALGGYVQHSARRHMQPDLTRYLFASAFAAATGRSPQLRDFPKELLPNHKNVRERNPMGATPFEDRFRVQCGHRPSSTVVSHIAKDGHYYIHYEPSQCRSLTVREAARLQTFPDDYFFEGNRTQQYTQVGNAVPPLLALKLARIVHDILTGRQ